jgi:hypothetical protein
MSTQNMEKCLTVMSIWHKIIMENTELQILHHLSLMNMRSEYEILGPKEGKNVHWPW